MRRTWGVLHVLHERSSGRAPRLLRPVLLAGAATALWLALSATAASAETGADLEIPGGLNAASSSPSTPPESASRSASRSAGGDSSGLLSPVLGQVAGSVERVIASIPAAPAVVPASTVTDLASPAVELVDTGAAALVGTIIPVATEALPATAPVVEPLGDVLTGAQALPLPPVASAPPAPAGPEAARLDATPARTGGAATSHPNATRADVAAVPTPAADEYSPPQSGTLPVPPAVGGSVAPLQPGGDLGGEELPSVVPGVPGWGAGSSQSPSGPSAATVTAPFQLRPPPGVSEATKPLPQASKPAPFDPGSSPD